MAGLFLYTVAAAAASATVHDASTRPIEPAASARTAHEAQSEPSRADVQPQARVGQEDTEPPMDPRRYAAGNMYPLWESNGLVLGHRNVRLGTSEFALGFGNVAQVGLKPISLMMRVPNLQAKMQVLRSLWMDLAIQVGAYGLLPGASEEFISSRYTSRIYAPRTTIGVFPVSVGVTCHLARWLLLHGATTALSVFAKGPIKNEVTVGHFTTLELLPINHHSLFLHVGEIGMWHHDQWIAGASYRLQAAWFEARLGYFYRKTADGMQSQPLLQLGVLL